MRITVFATLLLGLALCAKGDTVKEDESLLSCIADDDTMGCLRSRLARDIDQIEMQVTGKINDTPMSAVIEQAGNLMAELVDDVQSPEKPETEQEEGRGKKIGKRKKKHLQKLLGLAMLFKAKISLLLQLISTHFQLKFFVIAVLSLIINAARFWIDLKKSPSKVIYYEHAQHQHHYDHDDHDSGYWGRSSNDSPQDLAYSAYAPQTS